MEEVMVVEEEGGLDGEGRAGQGRRYGRQGKMGGGLSCILSMHHEEARLDLH